jgi:hypothetical protein
MLVSMLGGDHGAYPFRLGDGDLLIAALVLEGLIIAHWTCRNTSLEVIAGRVPWWSLSVTLALMLVAITLSSGESEKYVYFNY